MKEELKRRWVDALRSGKYRQGKGYLRSASDEFCCLGVLCDILDPFAWTLEGDNPVSPPGSYAHRDGEDQELPPSIGEETGLHWSHTDALVDMNDGGDPFDAIAVWIEENIEASP